MFWHSRRQHEINTKGAIAHELTNMRQLLGNLMGESTSCAINPEATGIGYSRNGFHIMSKAKYWTIDTKSLAHRTQDSTHRFLFYPSVIAARPVISAEPVISTQVGLLLESF